MNQRIKELEPQCWEMTEFGLRFNHEKYAEMIIKECSKVIVNGGYRNPALGEKHPLTPLEIATMIKEHFGVEE